MNSRRLIPFLSVCLALVLSACTSALGRAGAPASGPGGTGECDSCAQAEVSQPALAPGGVAQAAAADGGQTASNQPTQRDPGARGIHTAINRGSGANTDSSVTSEVRSQAGAPSVNQGLILPTTATASASIADNPGVKAILSRLADLRAAWKDALARGNVELAGQLSTQIDTAEARLIAASAGASQGTVYNVYDLRGSRNSQIVANGSKSGDGKGGAVDPEGADAIGRSAADVTKNALGSEPAPVPEGPASGLPPLPAPPGMD